MFIFLSLFWEPSCGDVGRGRAQTLTLYLLESRLDLPSAVSTRDEKEYPHPSLWGRKSMSHNPRAAEVLAASPLVEWSQIHLCATSLLPQEAPCSPWENDALGSVTPAPEPWSSGGECQSWRGMVGMIRRVHFLEFVLFTQNSLSNSLGDMENTLGKSSLDRQISNFI